jgi:putative DNA primase/helicase
MNAISEKFKDFTDDRTCNRRWVSVKTKTPVIPGTDKPVEWRKVENRYTWQQIQMLPGDYGIVLDRTGLTCIDFDKCLADSGIVAISDVADILSKLDTWTEISQSGTGLHAWVVTDTDIRNRKPGGCFELISDGHVRVTGNPFPQYADKPIRLIDGAILNRILHIGVSVVPQSKPITGQPIPNGKRNDSLFKLAASLRAKGLSEPAIRAALAVENQRLCNPPSPDDEISRIAASAGKYAPGVSNVPVQNDLTEKPYDYHDIAEAIRGNYKVISFKKTLFRYQDGVYIEDEGFLDSCITQELLERGIDSKERVTTAAQQVRHYLMYAKVETSYPFNNYHDAFPVRNGILKINFTTGTTDLLPFSPEYRFNYRLNVAYDAAADGTPLIKYLDSLGTDTDILLQIPAHAILSMLGRVYKKAYFLQGTKNSGKSTFIDLLVRHLFGISVCSSISLQALLFDRFRLAELDGKVLNAYADLSDQKLRDIGTFKTLTGGDLITVERKHRDPYQLRNKSLLLFSANKFPKISTGDDAFWDRWIALEFKKSFLVDTTFTDRTFTDTNLSGFLNIVLLQMQQIIKNGIKVTDSVEHVWLNDASSCHRFIQDDLERCPGAVLVKGEIYSRYVEYCQGGDFEIEPLRCLTDAMLRSGALSARPTLKGTRQHCYQGFGIKSMAPVFPDKEIVQAKVTA